MYKAVFADDDTAVLITAVVQRLFQLDLNVTEDARELRNLPTKGLVVVRLHLHLWMLSPVDELQSHTQVLTDEPNTALWLVSTTVVQLDECHYVLKRPCTTVLNLALNLPTHAIGGVVPLVITHA